MLPLELTWKIGNANTILWDSVTSVIYCIFFYTLPSALSSAGINAIKQDRILFVSPEFVIQQNIFERKCFHFRLSHGSLKCALYFNYSLNIRTNTKALTLNTEF